MDEADLEDKKGRRKALRFHTAKIESASARRNQARTALGGDDDVPYRERNKEKERKKQLANVNRGLGDGGDDLDDEEPEISPGKTQQRKRGRDEDGANDERGGGGENNDDDDGYRSLAKRPTNATHN